MAYNEVNDQTTGPISTEIEIFYNGQCNVPNCLLDGINKGPQEVFVTGDPNLTSFSFS